MLKIYIFRRNMIWYASGAEQLMHRRWFMYLQNAGSCHPRSEHMALCLEHNLFEAHSLSKLCRLARRAANPTPLASLCCTLPCRPSPIHFPPSYCNRICLNEITWDAKSGSNCCLPALEKVDSFPFFFIMHCLRS